MSKTYHNCKVSLSLQILNIEPGLAYLGLDFEEAAELQRQHIEVIQSLQSKQSPVEDLLRQADDLIACQKPKAEVYASMAESLGLAWRDLNFQLDQRKLILDQNYLFQGHLQDFMQKADSMLKICNKSINEKGIKAQILELQKAKRGMLESSVYALQEGDELLNKLDAMKQKCNNLDCRPGLIKQSIQLAIGQVELWLESLHDKRVQITLLFDRKMEQLRDKLSQLGENALLYFA